jgi:FKBP-type peptidyl-prolyl cis-trans isomerase 2
MKIAKKDFIEIDFTGKIKDGEVFDSTLKEDLEKLHAGSDHDIKPKPFVFCVGQGMFLEALDEFLIGKEVGKEYEIDLGPEKAFGNRERTAVQTMPPKVFKEQKINPVPGAVFNFDGKMGRVLAVSGGRVMVDFNHALAGKDVHYKIKILKKIDDLNEKIKALNDFFFRMDLKFEVKDKKLILEIEKQAAQFAKLFEDKFKEILDLDLEIKEVEVKEPVKSS